MFKEFQRVAVAILFIPFASFCSFSFQDLTEAQAKSLLECLGLGHAWSTVQYYPDLSSISKMFKANFMLTTHIDSPHVLVTCRFRLAPVAFNRHRWRFETAKELWQF